MPEPVSRFDLLTSLAETFGLGAASNMIWRRKLAFAHVLNVQVSEDIWPGEAVDLFLLPFFAKSPYTGEFVHPGKVFEHMRCETLRLCSSKFSAKDYMEDELAFYYEFDGPSPFELGDSSDDEGKLLLDYPLDF